jgi:hypothetical protein
MCKLRSQNYCEAFMYPLCVLYHVFSLIMAFYRSEHVALYIIYVVVLTIYVIIIIIIQNNNNMYNYPTLRPEAQNLKESV